MSVRCLLLSALVVASARLPARAQKFDECTLSPLYLEASKPARFPFPLTQYFQVRLKGRYEKLTGKAIVQVLVDARGRACCRRIVSQNKQLRLDILDLPGFIRRMPAWAPAQDQGAPVNFALLLNFEFAGGTLTVVPVPRKE